MIDLSAEALDWMSLPPGPARASAFLEAAGRCRPWSDAVFAMSGWDAIPAECPDELMALLDQDLAPLRALIASGRARGIAELASADFARLTREPSPDVVLLVGCWGSNAVQARGPSGFGAVLCLEHCCDLEGSLRMSELQARAWLVHELAHCARYAATRLACEPGRLAERLGEMSLAERVADEGIASALQCASQPDADPAALLAFESADLEAITARADELTARVLASPRDAELIMHALHAVSERRHGLPSRWGYALGRVLALRALARAGSWRALLAMPADEVVVAAGAGPAR